MCSKTARCKTLTTSCLVGVALLIIEAYLESNPLSARHCEPSMKGSSRTVGTVAFKLLKRVQKSFTKCHEAIESGALNSTSGQ